MRQSISSNFRICEERQDLYLFDGTRIPLFWHNHRLIQDGLKADDKIIVVSEFIFCLRYVDMIFDNLVDLLKCEIVAMCCKMYRLL